MEGFPWKPEVFLNNDKNPILVLPTTLGGKVKEISVAGKQKKKVQLTQKKKYVFLRSRS